MASLAESFSGILNGIVMPVLLSFCGVFLAVRINLFRVLIPARFFRSIKKAASEGGASPLTSLFTALAGTLGVGNIAGVATAITAGGPGAVFWMWAGAIVSMSVKYGEVTLAVKYRRSGKDGFYGGSMYTIRDGASRLIGAGPARILASVFAVLCTVNSLIMGNLIQSKAASATVNGLPLRIAVCAGIGIGVAVVAFGGGKRIKLVASYLIPPLAVCYLGFSVFIVVRFSPEVPGAFASIFRGAWSPGAAVGGAAGFGIKEAVRYGVTRGIFSNEAGCGTSPTAHASANVSSPHVQGCFGIIEVAVDTLVLCTATALVIIIAQNKYGLPGLDGVPLTLEAFRLLAGETAYHVIGASVVLFAFATVIAQLYYGKIALSFLTRSRAANTAFGVLMAALSFFGWAAGSGMLWTAADVTVGVMTVINSSVLLLMSGQVGRIAHER